MAPLAIVLSGGNALGAFQGGALSILAGSSRQPDIICGTSVGSVNAVLFAAPRDGDPVKTLRTFWDEAMQTIAAPTRKQEALWAAILSLLVGRPSLSRSHLHAWTPVLGVGNSLQDLTPLARTLERLVDFEKQRSANPRVMIGAVALDPDEPRVFDTALETIGPEHVLASSSFPVLFPPTRIGDRFYVDGGVAANLPLEPLLALEGPPLDCIALELFTSGGSAPETLDAAADRAQSLSFSFQSERVLARVVEAKRPLRVVYAPYRSPDAESGTKTLDYSRRSIAMRWAAGENAMRRALALLEQSVPDGVTVQRL